MGQQDFWKGQKVKIKSGEWKGRIGEVVEIRPFSCSVVVISVLLENKQKELFYPSCQLTYPDIRPFDKMFYNIEILKLH